MCRRTAIKFPLVSRKIAAQALWAAFPHATERQVCMQAARVLGRSPDTYWRILRQKTDAKLSVIGPVLVIAAAARGIDLIETLGTPNEGKDKP